MNVLIGSVMSLIYDSTIRETGQNTIGMLPDYWKHVAASSSGKYHPMFSLGEGGLLRHSVLVAYFAHRIALSWGLTKYQHDLVILAALVHDGLKQGWNSDGHTVHEHPLLVAEWLRGFKNEVLNDVADIVETHMGSFTTSKHSNVVLPVPTSTLQLLLSAADMLAATKEIDFDFDRMVESINEEVAKRE